MSNTKSINSNTNCFWRFIEDYLPNYHSRDDVLCDDILYRYFEDDEVSDEDMLWILEEFNGDKKLVKEELVRLEKRFIEEALCAFYEQRLTS